MNRKIKLSEKLIFAAIFMLLCATSFAFVSLNNKNAAADETSPRIVGGVELKTNRLEFNDAKSAQQIHDIIADQQLQNLQITVNLDGTIKKVEDWDGSIPLSDKPLNEQTFQGFVAKSKDGAIVVRDRSREFPLEDTVEMPFIKTTEAGALKIELTPFLGVNLHSECDQDNNYPCWWDSHYKNQIATFMGEGNYNINIPYRGDFYSRGCPVDIIKWEWPVDSIDRSVATYTNLPANNRIIMNDMINGDKDQINVLGTRVTYSHC